MERERDTNYTLDVFGRSLCCTSDHFLPNKIKSEALSKNILKALSACPTCESILS